MHTTLTAGQALLYHLWELIPSPGSLGMLGGKFGSAAAAGKL